jgi:hypothetical protein
VPMADSHHFFNLWILNQMFRGSSISTRDSKLKGTNAYYMTAARHGHTLFTRDRWVASLPQQRPRRRASHPAVKWATGRT